MYESMPTSLLPKSVCTAEVVCCSPFELRFVRKVCLNFTATAHLLAPFPDRGEPHCIIHAHYGLDVSISHVCQRFMAKHPQGIEIDGVLLDWHRVNFQE